jgi:hypothetical protein
MNIEAQAFSQNEGEEEENLIEEAILDAGLVSVAEAPRLGTEAYHRLMTAAVGYMTEVKRVEQPVIPNIDSTYNPSDDYYDSKKKNKPASYVRDNTMRRQHHNTLAKMLLGKSRIELTKTDADKISDFAAYITGNEEYVGSWS